ncbi:hypothetical protein PPL_06205 [Heterostelium album PN500]|uniref:Uncharacterized protein n=1 Tax=Heterostelium pallidum (strain ATCC 26659 / Pp 5 / PN500) TaxID=670386 RepID=D3BCI0_HETP5|nr:hypothetical protein PPL_06205 [Heterostelium album PN500]EFA80970.1 hypothetical protein PPL_06205 [Heterostelium album PN500]|eukprot:XP_020433088.1 hypothetical protein PPL_06205 [Heterostelium album PN500]
MNKDKDRNINNNNNNNNNKNEKIMNRRGMDDIAKQAMQHHFQDTMMMDADYHNDPQLYYHLHQQQQQQQQYQQQQQQQYHHHQQQMQQMMPPQFHQLRQAQPKKETKRNPRMNPSMHHQQTIDLMMDPHQMMNASADDDDVYEEQHLGYLDHPSKKLMVGEFRNVLVTYIVSEVESFEKFKIHLEQINMDSQSLFQKWSKEQVHIGAEVDIAVKNEFCTTVSIQNKTSRYDINFIDSGLSSTEPLDPNAAKNKESGCSFINDLRKDIKDFLCSPKDSSPVDKLVNHLADQHLPPPQPQQPQQHLPEGDHNAPQDDDMEDDNFHIPAVNDQPQQEEQVNIFENNNNNNNNNNEHLKDGHQKASNDKHDKDINFQTISLFYKELLGRDGLIYCSIDLNEKVFKWNSSKNTILAQVKFSDIKFILLNRTHQNSVSMEIHLKKSHSVKQEKKSNRILTCKISADDWQTFSTNYNFTVPLKELLEDPLPDNRIVWFKPFNAFKKTLAFGEMVKDLVGNEDMSVNSETHYRIQSLIDDRNTRDFVMTDPPKLLSDLSNIKSNHLFSFYILMKLDNLSENGIPDILKYIEPLINELTKLESFNLNKALTPIFESFLSRYLIDPVSPDHVNTLCILALGFFSCKTINTMLADDNIYFRILRFLDANNQLNNEVSSSFFRKLKSKKIFLDSFTTFFKIFEPIEAENNNYQKYFSMLTKFLNSTTIPITDINGLTVKNEMVEGLSKNELYNRFELVRIFMKIDRSTRLSNGRVIYKLILEDKVGFRDNLKKYDSTTKENVLSNLHGFVETGIKKHFIEMPQLLQLLTDSKMLFLFTSKIMQAIGDYRHTEIDKIFIFSQDTDPFRTIQNNISSRFSLDDFYQISLYCPKQAISIPNEIISRPIAFVNNFSIIEDNYRKLSQAFIDKKTHGYYHRLTGDIVRNYLGNRGDQPSLLSLEVIDENPPCTLVHLMLFNFYLEFLNQNHTQYPINAAHGKLVGLVTDKSWVHESTVYENNRQRFKSILEENTRIMRNNWNPSYAGDYDHQMSILMRYFGAVNTKSSEELDKKYRGEVTELFNLRTVGHWLNNTFQFKITKLNIDIADVSPTNQIVYLKKDILSAKGEKGHVVVEEESIRFLRSFLSTEHRKFFQIIMEYYNKTEMPNQIDVLCHMTRDFMKKLIGQDEDIQLNDIFRTVISQSDINFKKEMEHMYAYFYPDKTFNNKENSLYEFINKATALFGIQANIHHLFNFIDSNKHYINVTDFDNIRDTITNYLQTIAPGQKLISVKTSQKIFQDITQLIGDLTYPQLVYFKYVNPDLIEFFASFKDFQTTNQIMTANLITDEYNSSLVNNTIHAYNLLQPFIARFQDTTKATKESGMSVNAFSSLREMCKSVSRLMENTQTDFTKIEYVVNNIAHVRGIYSSAGGTYNIESILPTVSEILKGSEFSSRTTKYEEGSVGWSIKISSSSLEFTQEKIEDFVQGLNITKSSNSSDTKTNDLVAKFQSVVKLLSTVHIIHCEMDRLFHPDYFEGIIKLAFNDATDLQSKKESLEKSLNEWKSKIQNLPTRLLLLKAHGLSSLISGYNKIFNHYNAKPDFVQRMATHVTPFIKYCYPYSGLPIKSELIAKIIVDNNLLAKYDYSVFLTGLVEGLTNTEEAYEDLSEETGPILVHLNSKDNLYNVLMQLNNSMLPHPSQLFYSYAFSKDIEYFLRLIEEMSGYTFFLIGIPNEKDKLMHWLSDHYSKQTTDKLARLYVISTERSMATDLFSFLPNSNTMFDTEWKNFKESWNRTKESIGIEQLVLVCGDCGTGKSYFIRSKKHSSNNPITVHLRPNFDAKPMIHHLRKHKDKKKIMIHFVISPYCDFDSFNHFIYPLITRGYVFGNRVEEIYNVPETLLLQIYVEIGSPLLGAKKYARFSDYLTDTIPLVQHLAEITDHTKTQWEVTPTELKCYSYVHSNPYQKPSLELGKKVANVHEYIQTIKKILLKEFAYNPAFLSDPKHLLHRKSFMKLLEERLVFLDAYYDTYAEVGLSDSESQSKNQQLLLQPYELYHYLILEAVKFSDPQLATAQNIWKEPPMITSRYLSQANKKTVSIDYIDFSSKPKLITRVQLVTLETAKQEPARFRTIIANIFGISSRTNIVLNLCQQYHYVLTPEFGIRLLMLHNKVKNQRSLVLTGDTGVGKTFILLFYSLLINAKNNSLPDIISRIREEVNKLIQNKTDFVLKGIMDGDQQSKLLPGEVSLIQIQDALTQLCEHDPMKESNNNNNNNNNNSSGSSSKFQNRSFQHTLFSTVENLIAVMMNNYPLIETPRNSLLYQIRFKSSTSVIIQNKEKLLEAVKEISSATFRNLFHRIIMHQKFTSKIFKNLVLSYIAEAKQLRHIDPNLKMLIFIDEFNTSPNDTLALINEIFIDGTLDGEGCIPDNIFWIGAMNPVKTTSMEAVDYTGQTTTTSHLSFVVQHPPPAMVQLFLNYGDFTAKNEQSFLESLFLVRDDIIQTTEVDLLKQQQNLKEIIIIGQNALRETNQARTHVSIRDITRVIDLYKFFRYTPVGNSILNCAYKLKDNNNQESVTMLHWMSIIASIGLTYYIRVSPGESRDLLIKKVNDYYGKQVDAFPAIKAVFSDANNMFKSIYSKFCETAKLPPGIALTESLKLNIFGITVAINSRLPICIVGPPGCSKTLSFGIVINNMNANKLDDPSSPWSQMTTADPFRYQCTPHTTDIEISSVFERSLNRQKTYDLSGGKSRCVVFFDEAGLVNENDSPMKIMHDYLDKVSQKMDKDSVDISVVILSNKVLDAAKTNRMLMLVHPHTITKEDEKALAVGCLYNNKVLTPSENQICTALCAAYKLANNHVKDTKPNLFHQRDFVYFLRHLARGLKNNQGVLNGEVLINSIERNFGGIPPKEFKEMAKEFFDQLQNIPDVSVKPGNLLDTDRTIKRIKESLLETLDTKQDPNTVPFRYMMIIDPTENESSLMILKELGINTTVIRVGGFERDSTTESLVNVVSQIKSEMASGGTVVLVNTHQIDACFYDVFNRYFTLLPTPDGSMHFIANVSFGTHSIFCPVHPEFKIIVHLPLSQMAQTQLPWLNRFEKYQLSIEKMLDYYIKKNLSLHTSIFETLKSTATHFIDEFHNKATNKSLLSGFSESETIPSLIYTIAKELKASDSLNIQPQRIFNTNLELIPESENYEIRQFNWKLLQIARPESIFNCKTLPQSYIEEYLLRQEHFNILRFLDHIFNKKFVKNDQSVPNKWTFFTRTSLTLHRLKDSEHMDNFHKILLSQLFKNGDTESEIDPMEIDSKENILKIIQLGSFKSSHSCDLELDHFKNSKVQKICMIIADMSYVNQHQVNFIVDRFNKFDKSKLLITICHYPPEFSLSNQTKLNSIFLNGIEYMYIDSLGLKIDTQLMESNQNSLDSDIRTWIGRAYGLKLSIDPQSLERTFEDMFFEHLRQVAMEMNPVFLPLKADPAERTFYSNADQRVTLIEDLFRSNKEWYNTTIQMLSTEWGQKDMFKQIITNISKLIVSGKLVHSFFDSIKNSMITFFYPMVSQIFKIVTNYQSYLRVSKIKDAQNSELVRLYIQSVRVPEINENIEERFEPVTLTVHQEKVLQQESCLPLYDSVISNLKTLFDNTLNLHPNRGIDKIFGEYTKYVSNHSLGPLIQYISENDTLYQQFQTDFVIRTMRFDKSWLEFVLLVIKKIFPIRSDSILLFIVCNYFYSPTIHYLKSLTTPLMNLKTNVSILQEFRNLNLDKDKLSNTNQAKSIITALAMKLIYKEIVDISPEAKNLSDITANWCNVVREILNRVPIYTILRQAQGKGDTGQFTSYIYILFNLCIFASTIGNIDTTESILSCIYRGVPKAKRFDPEDIFQPFSSFFSNVNRILKERGLPPVELSCFLTTFEPFINLSTANKRNFLLMCNNDKSLNQDFVSKIPMGWFCNNIFNSYDSFFKSYSVIIEEIFTKQGVTLFCNPVLYCLHPNNEVPTGELLQFLGVSKEEFQQEFKPNPNLINILYFVELERCRRLNLDTINLMVKWQEMVRSPSILERIKVNAMSTHFIDNLAKMLNDEGVEPTKNYLDNNKMLTTTMNKIFSMERQTKANKIQRRFNHMYLLNKISSEKTLVDILKNQAFLKTIAMEENLVTIDISMKESTLYSFTVDSSTDDGKLFKSIKDAVDSKSDEDINRLIAQCRNTPRSCGFFRMSLFLITYQYYLDDLEFGFIEKLIAPGSLFNTAIGNEPYINFFKKIIKKDFKISIKNFDEVVMKYPNKAKDHFVIGQLLVNYVAASIGSNSNFYLYELTRDFKKVCGKKFPATELIFRDCGMVYRLGGGADARIYCMKNNPLYKYMIGSTSWAVFSWTASCLVTREDVAYLTDPNIHFANFLEKKTIDGLTDYVGIRALTSISEVKINQDIVDQHIEPGHFLSELVYQLWDEAYTAPRPVMRAYFEETHSDKDVYAYENYLIEVIEKVRKDYPNIKTKRIDAVVSQSATLAQAIKCRQKYVTKFTSPFYDYEYIHDLITKKENKLLLYFSTNIATICISKYFYEVIQLIELIFKYFSRRLPQENQFFTIPECIKFLETHKYEDENTIKSIKTKWENAKKSWNDILEHLQIMEGGCRAMPDYEKVVQPITDDTPLVSLLFNRDLSSNGLIINLINNWVTNTQSKAVGHLDQVQKTELFQRIIESPDSEDNNIDIGNMSFDFGENFYLIGSNYNLTDFQKFISNCISHYQTFDRNLFDPKMSFVENKLIYNYVAGKINGGQQMKQYMVDFPYRVSVAQNNSKVSTNTSMSSQIIPEYVKELLIIQEKLDSATFGQEIKDPNIKIPLDMSTAKLHPEESETLCRFLTSLIARVINNILKDPINKTKVPGYLMMTLVEISMRIGLTYHKISKPIISHLAMVRLTSLKTISEMIIKNSLSYGHLYSGIVNDPVQADPTIINHFESICINLKNEASKENQDILPWIHYFEEIIQILASPKSKDLLKLQQPDTPLKDHVCNLLMNMRHQSPSKLYTSHSQFFQDNITLSYYSFFMRTIHEILSFLKIKDLNQKKEIYKEPHLYHFRLQKETPMEVDNKSNQVEDIQMEPAAPVLEVQKEVEEPEISEDELDVVVDSNQLIEIENEDRGERVEPKKEKIPDIGSYPHTGFQVLYNWLLEVTDINLDRFKLVKKGDFHEDFYNHVVEFRNSCKSGGKVPLHPIILDLIHITKARDQTGCRLLLQFLETLVYVDNQIMPSGIFKMSNNLICQDCKHENLAYQISYFKCAFEDKKDTDLVSLLLTNQQLETKQCAKCQEYSIATIPIDPAKYLFIQINRSETADERIYTKLAIPDSFDLMDIYQVPGKSFTYTLHAILKGNSFTRITNTIVEGVDLKAYNDIILNSCVSVIYSNAFNKKFDIPQQPQPAAQQPASQQPAPQQPASQQPASQQPTSQQPTSQQPTSQTDVVMEPASNAQKINSALNETFLDWISSIADVKPTSRELISKVLVEHGIDTFSIALSVLKEPEMLRNLLIEKGVPKITTNTFIRLLGIKIDKESFKLVPHEPENLDFFDWVRQLGFNEKSSENVITVLDQNDIITFDGAKANMDSIKEELKDSLPFGNIHHLLTHLELLNLN